MKRLLLVLFALACADMAAPVALATPMEPLAAYPSWWSEVEACAGRSGDFALVRWFRVQSDSGPFFTWEGRRRAGLWVAPHDIYLSDSLLLLPELVKHEMLHDLLGTGRHPTVPFVTPCAVRYPILIPEETR